MSRYFSKTAILKEQLMQFQRRRYIEVKHRDAIMALKEELKIKPTIVPELRALGLTEAHARTLNANLIGIIAYEARLAEIETKKKAAIENVIAEPVETLEKLANTDVQIELPQFDSQLTEPILNLEKEGMRTDPAVLSPSQYEAVLNQLKGEP